ncbi:copper chaperone PCu(A)C [Streptantibioticus ferralitis]|uniref:Copper chaperone PCu(A)C n=1 Tax=Streptantibioticus ferralitis TaxID=236510 RepID=A0ABT5Z0V2_9ACTN|nr:copper chaperone PCu(A)C [Streptantibioticus ferralitis]MDF2257388.1 copper chaperone PCu(A)C [Streptantibioticus ferralitis]
MRRLAASAAALALGALALTGCGSSGSSQSAGAKPELKVSGGYVPQPAMDDMAAGYFTVTNTGGADDQLTGVTSDVASDVTMHRTQSNAMQEVKSFSVPAQGKLVLSTGGNHLMLMGMRKKPTVGEKVSFVLHFAKSSPITVNVPVEPATYRPKG